MARRQDKGDFESANKYRTPQENRLTEQELCALGKEIKNYRTESGGFDERAWLRAKGAVNKNNAIIVHDFKQAKYNHDHTRLLEPYDCQPILFEQLQEDLAQLWKWKGRKEYGEKKRLEGLDTLAETLTVPPEYKNGD